MRSFQLDTKSYNEIEGILKHIAQVNDITDVESVHMAVDKYFSLIRYSTNRFGGPFYKGRKPNQPSLLGTSWQLLKILYNGVSSLLQDTELTTAIRNFLNEVATDPSSGIRGVDVEEFVTLIVKLIETGTHQIVQEAAEQAKTPEVATPPSTEAATPPIASPMPASKLHSSYNDINKIAMKGVGGRILDWGKDKATDYVTRAKNFLVGANADQLATQLTDIIVRKKYVTQEHAPKVKEMLLSAVNKGLEGLKQQLAQEEEASTETEETSTDPVQPQSAATQPQIAKQQFPKPPTSETAQGSVENLKKDPGILQMFETFKAQRPDLNDAKLFEIILDAAVKIKGSK